MLVRVKLFVVVGSRRLAFERLLAIVATKAFLKQTWALFRLLLLLHLSLIILKSESKVN